MDLVDAKKKLLFPDSLVIQRVILRLIEKASEQHKTPISSDTPQIPELRLLWETCGNDFSTASSFASNSLLQIVQEGKIAIEYAIRKFLHVALSTRNFGSAVNSLSKLVLMSNKDSETVLYTLNYPKHPFITLLESQPNAGPLVLQSIMSALRDGEKNHHFRIMEPVITYIMFNPTDTVEVLFLRRSLLSELTVFGESCPEDTINYFCKILPWFQVNELSSVLATSYFISLINHLVKHCNYETVGNHVLQFIAFGALCVADCCLNVNSDPHCTISVVEDLISHFFKMSSSSVILNAIYVLIGHLMKRCSGGTLQKLVTICTVLVSSHPPIPLIASIVTIPVLHLMSETSTLRKNTNGEFYSCLLHLLRGVVDSPATNASKLEETMIPMDFIESFVPVASLSLSCADFAVQLEKFSPRMKIEWMQEMQETFSRSQQESNFLFSLVSGLFLMSTKDPLLLQSCLQLLEAICDKQSELSVSLLSLLLYKQSLENDPKCIHLVMEYIPKTTSHKYSVGPVLSMLQAMGAHKELKPQAIYMMLQLWKKQQRCFPYLQKMLVEKDTTVFFDTGITEILIAQASAIRELCIQSPVNHGGEFLQFLSLIINESLSDAATPAILLALDAIYHLCKSETLDLNSTWKRLAPKLMKDKRASVVVHTCNILSLAPELKVKSHSYDNFMTEASSYLWRLISSPKSVPLIVGAAYKALAPFPIQCHALKELPGVAKVNLKLPPSMISTPFEMGKSPEDVLSYVPGYCFMDILSNTKDSSILEGYSTFLQSIIKQEVKDLPRSIYSQRKYVGRKHVDDVLSQIPGVLCKQFELKKTSSIQKSLAVGILLSYEPPMELSKQGKPSKRSVMLQASLFEQILGMLLNEVNLDCSDWQRCVLLPNAWAAFMERAFLASEESRVTELELEFANKKMKETDIEKSVLLDGAWLWVRDRLMNVIKHNCQNSSTAAANSVFAVAGLVHATEKFYAGLEDKLKDATYGQFVNHEEFVIMCTESIFSIVDPDFRPSLKNLDYLLTPSSKQSTSACSMIRGCAACSLCNVHFILKRHFPSRAKRLCDLLLDDLTSEASLPSLSLFSGIGLGNLIRCLSQDEYSNNSADQINIQEFVSKLELICKLENFKCGSLVALTLAASSLCQNGNPKFSQWITSTCHTFRNRLKEEPKSSMEFEYLSVCISCLFVSAAVANVLPQSEVVELNLWFMENMKLTPKCSSTAISVGILSDALLNMGYSKIEDTAENQKRVWLSTLASEKEPTLNRLAALNGLCAFYSMGRGLAKMSSNIPIESKTSSLRAVFELMMQLISAPRDSGLQTVACWELGRLHAVNVGQQNDTNTAHKNYSYLGERSVLKPLLEFILDSTNKGEKRTQIEIALIALSQDFGRPLPPLNWNVVLPSVIYKNDSRLTEVSLKIAVQQMTSSANALTLISSYTSPPLVYSLSENCIQFLLDSLPLLASSLSSTDLKAFLDAVVGSTSSLKESLKPKRSMVLKALTESHKLLSTSTTTSTIHLLEDMFKHQLMCIVQNDNDFRSHVPVICQFLSQMNEVSQEKLIHHLEDSGYYSKAVVVTSFMVKSGMRPVSYLKSFIEFAKEAPIDDKSAAITAIFDCFTCGLGQAQSDIHKPENCISFLMESIGWLTLLTGCKRQLATQEVSDFLFDVCLAVLVGSSGSDIYSKWPKPQVNHGMLMQALPSTIFILREVAVWKQAIPKIMDWLVKMKCLPSLKEKDKYFIQAAICALRTSEQFCKLNIWTENIIRPTL